MAVLVAMRAPAQSAHPIEELPRTLEITAGRPVQIAVSIAELRAREVITYEDPELVFEPDLIDAFHREGSPRRRIAKDSSLSVPYLADANERPEDIAKLVADIVSAGSRGGVKFTWWRTADRRFHVAPIARRNALGKMVPYVPLLDAVVTFPAANRTADEFLDMLCHEGGAVRHRALASSPRWFQPGRTSRGADHEKARDVLESFLAERDPRYSWKLLCDPLGGLCALNVSKVF